MPEFQATPSIPPIFSQKGGAVFTVDPIRAEIYYYDDTQHAIFRRSIHGGNSTVITKKGGRSLAINTILTELEV